ncbi:hypothetical protein [Candidatus Mesenet endosymbiont of Agriotes lineatus]|uniref:hypothetical protein n=1 Tax=Candidatus Mesenet endosymbiont of Agriotes lineatus TaxID=3077948 RepID=UPI0030CA64A3
MDIYPSYEFWENDLEVPAHYLLSRFQNPEIRKFWLDSLTGKQLNIIFKHCFNHQQQLFEDDISHNNMSVQQKRKIIANGSDVLFNYYLISYFDRTKLESAISEVARLAITQKLMELYLIKNNTKYDKRSLLFLLFQTNYSLLKSVYHFDKVQKRGSTAFTLQKVPRQVNNTPFKDFISQEIIEQILKEDDARRNDSLKNQLQGLFYHQNRIYVFIRRASDFCFLLNSNKVVHGHKPDWIIIDFSLNANQVNLCTKSISQGLRITNYIVSQYFERECSFINTHNQTEVAQVRTFLNACVHKSVPNINLFELKFSSSQTYITLTTNDIEQWLQKLEPSVGSILHNVSLVQHARVIFQNKKVTLSFQINGQDQNYIAINYSEHILNKKERDDFKSLIKDTYGITVLSKAKALSK